MNNKKVQANISCIEEKMLDSIFIFLNLKGKTKEDVLLNIAIFAKQKGLVKDESYLYQKLLERENVASTAIGNGVALPEACWIEMSLPYAFILCRLKKPVEFGLPDKFPVRIVIVSLGRDKEDLSRYKLMVYLVIFLKSKICRDKFLKAKTKDIYSTSPQGVFDCKRKVKIL